jgi:hypothetical protein
MRRPMAVVTAATALWMAVACLDISSPSGNVVAITTVLVPTPSVVEGDVSRDTTGKLDSLKAFAFDAKGDTIRDVVVRFFAIDSTHKLVVDSVSGIAHGLGLSPFAQVVARVTPANGKGAIQTPQVPFPVVPTPVSITRGADTTFLFSVLSNGSAVTDSFATTLLSPPLNVTVHGNGDTLVQSYVVSYQIVKMPPSKSGAGPTVVLLDRSGNDSTAAVTNTSGVASRQLRIRPSAILDPNLVIGAATDTVIVRVRVRYKGADLPITPNDSFIVTIHASP